MLEYLHSFSNTNGNGAYPAAGLLQAADGSFYGTTSSGGASGEGTIFQFAYDPRIAVPPANRLVAVGSTVSFSVVAAGTGQGEQKKVSLHTRGYKTPEKAEWLKVE